MPHYKLYYFNTRGRAELIRYIFAVAGQEYEDIRYTQEEWQQHKADFPFGTMPVLEIDGQKIGQSAAIAHYVAVQLGLAGKTEVDHLKAHALAETTRDLFEPLVAIHHEKDEERQKKLKDQYLNVTLKTVLERFEKYAEQTSGFLVGDSLTYADLALFDTLFLISNALGTNVAEPYPHVNKLCKAVEENPKIAAWIAKRPKSER